MADLCLDAVMDADEGWAVRIRTLKFQAYNQTWLQARRDGAAAAALRGCCWFLGSEGGRGEDGAALVFCRF